MLKKAKEAKPSPDVASLERRLSEVERKLGQILESQQEKRPTPRGRGLDTPEHGPDRQTAALRSVRVGTTRPAVPVRRRHWRMGGSVWIACS
jgi:hypothetical protein